MPVLPTHGYVDAHCHASELWHEPVESLLFHMDRNGVGQATLIMFPPDPDGSYHAECVRRYPDRFIAVDFVDHTAPGNTIERLERVAGAGATAVRLLAGARSPGDDPLALWRAADRLGLAVSVKATAREYASNELARLIAELPRLQFMVEHFGYHGAVDLAEPPELREKHRDGVFALARFPNVTLKIAPLGEFAQWVFPVKKGVIPFVEPVPPLIPRALETFGPSRLMWGSDYSCVSDREGYALALRWPLEAVAHLTEADRAAIFGGTARRVHRMARA